MLIPTSTLDELYCDGVGAVVAGFRYVADQEIATGRWDLHKWMVLEDQESNDFFAVEYSEGLTENQEGDFPWKPLYEYPPDSVDAFQVYPEVVTAITYRRSQ